jgi:hypothetical protein
MRNGFGGELKNSIVVNTGTVAGMVVGTGGAPVFTVANNIAAESISGSSGLLSENDL